MIEIFISYADADKKKIRAIEKFINENKEHLHPTIVADKRKVLTSLTDKIKKGILECNYFVPVITRASIKTQWLNQEIGFAFAMNKKIYPIIEEQIMNKLKGFVHKEVDLPYKFKGNKINPRLETSKFNKEAKQLINDILIDNNILPNSLTIENLFPGKWKLIFQGKYTGIEEFEIIDGNKYFAKPQRNNSFKHYFNLENISIDLKNSKIKFTKVGIPPNTPSIRRIECLLTKIKLGKQYEGIEKEDNGVTNVSYFKIP